MSWIKKKLIYTWLNATHVYALPISFGMIGALASCREWKPALAYAIGVATGIYVSNITAPTRICCAGKRICM